MLKERYLAGSPRHLEHVLGLDLAKRAAEGRLTHLLLNQPPVCNSHCRRCFMPDGRRGHVVNPLSLEESCRVVREAAEAGFVSLEISGEGEPLLSGNISGVVECAHDCNLITTVITNGHALTPQRVKFLFERNVTLVVSLFSMDREQYEADNRRPGSFSRVIRNLLHASEVFRAGKKVAADTGVYRIAVHATAQADNIHALHAIREFCTQEDIFFSVAPLASVGGGAEMPDALLSDKEKNQVADLGDNSIILSRSSQTDVGRQVCGTCLYGLNISYNGNVLFDAHAGYEVEGLLGSVRIDSVTELVRRQRIFAPHLFNHIDGFCPMRDPAWPDYIMRLKKYGVFDTFAARTFTGRTSGGASAMPIFDKRRSSTLASPNPT